LASACFCRSATFDSIARRSLSTFCCEASHAADFVYADAIDRTGAPTPIGVSCRLCPRIDCDQRAFPPSDKAIDVDPSQRDLVPYRIVEG
jgi:predicted transcriptional regulator